MGILESIMRGVAKTKGACCYKCNTPVVVKNVDMPLLLPLDVTVGDGGFEGYCPGCHHYVCSKHAIMLKTEEGPWFRTYKSGCPKCKRELSL